MSYENWKDKTSGFEVVDVRGISGNFFPGLKIRAEQIPVHEGLHIIQSFEPIPLYEVMEQLGFERFTDQVAADEYHVYFYRIEEKKDAGDTVIRPAALTSFPFIGKDLADIVVTFGDLTCNDKNAISFIKRDCFFPLQIQ